MVVFLDPFFAIAIYLLRWAYMFDGLVEFREDLGKRKRTFDPEVFIDEEKAISKAIGAFMKKHANYTGYIMNSISVNRIFITLMVFVNLIVFVQLAVFVDPDYTDFKSFIYNCFDSTITDSGVLPNVRMCAVADDMKTASMVISQFYSLKASSHVS